MAALPATPIQEHAVVSPKEWLASRKELLRKEKEFNTLRDELSQKRRELPWERVEKNYVFDGPNGKQTLADLFDGRSQLIIYHFMFGPGWEEGCPSCSYLAESFWRQPDSPGQPRCHAGRGFAGADRPDRSLQEADGLAVPLGVIVRERVQPRLSRVVHQRGNGEREGELQLRHGRIPQ